MNINDDDRLFISKVRKLVPEEEQRILLLTTLLGMSGVLTEFVMNNHKIKSLPMEVQYACANTAANMIAFISDGEEGQVKNMNPEPYQMGEQTQERIYRKMKWTVVQLYNFIQENEKQ